VTSSTTTDVALPPGYDDVLALVGRTGMTLAAAATRFDRQLAEALVGEADAMREALGLAEGQERAGQGDLTWRQGFMAGAVHAVREVSDAFSAALGDESGADAQREEETSCHLVGRWLATIQIGRLLRLLAMGVTATDRMDAGSQGYQQGMEYAVERMIGAYQALLEQRVLAIRQLKEPTDEQRRVATLLFVALTEPNRQRVIKTLGPNAESIIIDADEREWVKCLNNTTRPMRVTGKGAVATLDLASKSAA
jgi:hypothetical protein